MKKEKECRECYEKVILISKGKNPQYFALYADGLSTIGKNEDAIECCDKALEIDGNHFLSWQNKGEALFNLKKYEDALVCFEKAENLPEHKIFALQYNEDIVLEFKGKTLIRLGKTDEGLDCLDRAKKAISNNI